MKKNLTKDQIVETTLELMRYRYDLTDLNLRSIARALGCAHTNLYNYFPSYSDLLWEAHTHLQAVYTQMLTDRLKTAGDAQTTLSLFFLGIVEMYLDNKGWFRLSWHELIGGSRPQRDIAATAAAADALNAGASHIWQALYGAKADPDIMRRILHNTHCYIVGEVSNFLLGRGLIADETALRAYIAQEAEHMFTLCLREASHG